MSHFNPIKVYEDKIEQVDFIVPERLREACRVRGINYDEAANLCDIPFREFGRMANGHSEVPKEYLFKLMKGLNFPKNFFYQVKWSRV